MTAKPPEIPSTAALERRWAERWARDGTYRFDRTRDRAGVFSIDTPPPTVSGSLHVGHAFSYAQTDVLARYQRMRGKAVFYPMGWDDNGLPTERRVQRWYGVRCDPSLPYDPAFEPPEWPGRHPVAVSRPNFMELCSRLAMADEQAFEALWRRLGLSVDWSLTYVTIGEQARRVSQRAFLRLLARGMAYQAEAPTTWDVDFQTAVAQGELEDRDVEGTAWRVVLAVEGAGEPATVEVETTRPELLGACVAVVVHPDDGRHRRLLGRTVRTPLFGARVPVLAHRQADPDRATGAAMVCTFGDPMDLIWWRELGLPLRPVLSADGTIRPLRWDADELGSADPAAAQRAHDELAGLPAPLARRRAAALLAAAGALSGEPRTITRPVRFYQHGSQPVEILTSRQWFVSTLALRGELAARGAELAWHPAWMASRFQAWVEGLNSDWCISRQRYFGVPFPLWYRVGPDGEVSWDRPVVPDERRLPVDPSTDAPDGLGEHQRGRPGGFVGAPGVMDTWATSALTPEIAGGWVDDPDLFERVFPMDLRPQGHDIIRTWLFYSLARAHVEHGTLPWAHALISGWVVDPAHRKLAKSRGNAPTLEVALDRFGADALRWWAASRRPGLDTTFDEGQLRVGRRLATKLLNAARFVGAVAAAAGEPSADRVADPLDRAMLAGLADVVDEATAAFDGFDAAGALEAVDGFFWTFCDDYVELVKGRAYGEAGDAGQASAAAALRLALDTVVRLLAPVLPFATEEVWSWRPATAAQGRPEPGRGPAAPGSVHRAPWPDGAELRAAASGAAADHLEAAGAVLAEIRKAKTAARRSLRAPVAWARVRDRAERLALLADVTGDLGRAGRVASVTLGEPAGDLAVEVGLD